MKKYGLIAAALCVLLLIAYWLYRCNKSKIKIKYYFSPGCPHCRNFMPAWDQFASKASGMAEVEKVNCAVDSSACAGIRGVPHVVFSSDKSEIVYPGERTPDALYNFLERFSSQ